MSEGSPFLNNDQIKEGKQGGPEVEPFDPDKAIAEAAAETVDVDKDIPTKLPHETHIPVERVTEQPSTLTQKPFEELGSFKHLFKGTFTEDAIPTQKVPNLERTLEEPSASQEDFQDEKKKEIETSQKVAKGSIDGVRTDSDEAVTDKESVLQEQRIALHLLQNKLGDEWQNYRFTGELTPDGYLVEKPDKNGHVNEPSVQPTDILYIPKKSKSIPENKTKLKPVTESHTAVSEQEVIDVETAPPTQSETFEAPATPEGATVEPGIGDTEGETSVSPQKEPEAEVAQPVPEVEVPAEPAENLEPAIVPASDEKVETVPVSDKKITLEPESEKKEITLEEDSVVFQGDKENPDTWKVVEPHQKVIEKGGPEDVYSRKSFRDISDPDFVAGRTEFEEKLQQKEVATSDVSANERNHNISTEGLTLEEDSVVFQGDKKDPSTWKVVEPHQKVIEKGGPEDVYSRKPFRDISDPNFVANPISEEKPKPSSNGPTPPPPPEGPTVPATPDVPRGKWDGFTQVYEGKFDQQGNKLPGQDSNEEFNLAGSLKKEEKENDSQDTAKEEKSKDEKADKPDEKKEAPKDTKEKKELPPEFVEAKKKYIEYRTALQSAERELGEVITEYQRARKESGWGRFLNKKELQQRIDTKREAYDTLVNKFLTEREALITTHVHTRKEGTTVRKEEAEKYFAFLASLASRRVDRGAEVIARVALKANEHSESTYWFVRHMQQSWKTFRALPPHKKVLWTTALAASAGFGLGVGGAIVGGLGLGGIAASGFTGAATLGSRRFVGGTLGMAAAIGSKLGVDKYAEGREKGKLTEETQRVMTGTKLSDAVSSHVETKKQTKNIKRGGTALAAGVGVAAGVSATDMVAQAQEQIAQGTSFSNIELDKIDPSRGLRNFGNSALNAGKSFREWIGGGAQGAASVSGTGAEDVTSAGESPTASYEVQPGDNVWDILQKKLTDRGLLEGMSERQRTHFIDALKDEVAAEVKKLSPEDRLALGFRKEDIDFIVPKDKLDLSQFLDKQSIDDALAKVPNIAPVAVETTPDTIPADTAPVQSSPEDALVPESQKPFTSQSNLDAEAQKPFTSEGHLTGREATTASAVTAADAMPPMEETTEATIPTDGGPRLQDMPGRSLEQIGKEFPDYRGEKSLPAFKGVWEELKGQGKIDRHLLGRYPHLQSGWGPLSHVPVRDLYDNVQGLKYNIDGKPPIELSPQAESELRSFIEITRQMPTPGGDGGNILEIGVEKNWTVGKYIEAIADSNGLRTPEPTATLAALDQVQHTQALTPEPIVMPTASEMEQWKINHAAAVLDKISQAPQIKDIVDPATQDQVMDMAISKLVYEYALHEKLTDVANKDAILTAAGGKGVILTHEDFIQALNKLHSTSGNYGDRWLGDNDGRFEVNEINKLNTYTKSNPGLLALSRLMEKNGIATNINSGATSSMNDVTAVVERTGAAPVATLAAVEQAQHVQNIPTEQSPQGAPTTPEEATHHPLRKTGQQPPERVRTHRQRPTRIIEYDKTTTIETRGGHEAKVGVFGRLGTKFHAPEVPVNIGDRMHEDVLALYEGRSKSSTGLLSRLLTERPKPEWAELNAGDLLQEDKAFRRAWNFWKEGISTNSAHPWHGLKPEVLRAHEEALMELTGKEALMELIDEAKKAEDARWQPTRVTIGRDVINGDTRVHTRRIFDRNR